MPTSPSTVHVRVGAPKMAITAPTPGLRRGLAQVGTAAGFEVSFPDDPVVWARRHNGVALITIVDGDGLAVLRGLRNAGERLTIVALTDPGIPHLGHAALRAGADILVDQSMQPQELLLTVRLARHGRALMPDGPLNEAADPWTTLGEHVMLDLDNADLELLQDLAEGATIQRMARRRHLATRTVERRLHRLYARIGVRDRVQAVAKAVQCGLIRTPF